VEIAVESRTSTETDGGDPIWLSAAVRRKLLQLAYHFVFNRAAAEDAVQDTMTIAYQRRDQLQDQAKCWPWLCRILIQRCHLVYRNEQRWLQHREALVRRRPQSQPDALDPTSDEAKEIVRRLLPKLSNRQYEVIVLRHLQGMPYQEIGQVLGIKASTARVQAKAGREALLKLVLREYPQFGSEWAKKV